jgi:hypothetical protein
MVPAASHSPLFMRARASRKRAGKRSADDRGSLGSASVSPLAAPAQSSSRKRSTAASGAPLLK